MQNFKTIWQLRNKWWSNETSPDKFRVDALFETAPCWIPTDYMVCSTIRNLQTIDTLILICPPPSRALHWLRLDNIYIGPSGGESTLKNIAKHTTPNPLANGDTSTTKIQIRIKSYAHFMRHGIRHAVKRVLQPLYRLANNCPFSYRLPNQAKFVLNIEFYRISNKCKIVFFCEHTRPCLVRTCPLLVKKWKPANKLGNLSFTVFYRINVFLSNTG